MIAVLSMIITDKIIHPIWFENAQGMQCTSRLLLCGPKSRCMQHCEYINRKNNNAIFIQAYIALWCFNKTRWYYVGLHAGQRHHLKNHQTLANLSALHCTNMHNERIPLYRIYPAVHALWHICNQKHLNLEVMELALRYLNY